MRRLAIMRDPAAAQPRRPRALEIRDAIVHEFRAWARDGSSDREAKLTARLHELDDEHVELTGRSYLEQLGGQQWLLDQHPSTSPPLPRKRQQRSGGSIAFGRSLWSVIGFAVALSTSRPQDGNVHSGDSASGSSSTSSPASDAQAAAHQERVAANFEPGTIAHDVALYHDHIEDDLGPVPEHIRLFVEILTRRRDEAYKDYIERVWRSQNAVAIRVKTFDLLDNLARCEGQFGGEVNPSRAARYRWALDYLGVTA
jgi:hypothetical protein